MQVQNGSDFPEVCVYLEHFLKEIIVIKLNYFKV